MEASRQIAGILAGDRHLDHAGLASLARHAAGGLKLLGVQPGETVALLLRNDIAFFVATLAAQGVEAYAVPINWHGTAEEIAYILRDSGARVLVAHSDLLAKLAGNLPGDCTVLSVATPPEIAEAYHIPAAACSVAQGATDWEQWVRAQPELTESPRSARGSIVYTSGSTGRPKGVVRAPAEGEARDRALSIVDEIFGVPRGTPVRLVVTGPLYHPAPNFSAMRAIEPGSLVVLQPKFDELKLLAMIQHYGITHLNMVPTMFIRLLRLEEHIRYRFDLTSLRRVTHAAAPCPIEIKRRMIDWWGPVIHEFYGGTETGTVTIHGSEEALAKPGTVGRPLNNCVVKILDDQGNELPPNTAGEVFCRNYNLPDFEYRGLPEKRREVQQGDLITVGDIGYCDDDGYLFLLDRKRDLIISGGVNIYPAEIEHVLITMPGVKDCAVFGIPSNDLGESVCAHVELLDDAKLTPEEITAWLRHRLGGLRTPGLVRIDSNLPREDSGKIMKKNLRAAYWAAADRKI